ncbi:G-protein coupled receptor Mth2 [Chionoecetes opilio]|uniref:G-protein coupled receptor Mth2 n=1 Tax=Chionoecetes opilio TaxID=41210 RepID=A0A8J4Y2K2_CHIOP|nr:G-protein coupled receptor Mth2 [Chionoecetes opilio]
MHVMIFDRAVFDRTDPEECEVHRTKVFVCLDKKQQEPGLYWTGVGLAHAFLLLTLFTFFFVRDLRCLQGQYMICFLISLLLYNICLLPGSVVVLAISFVSCVSLGAVKYFFFCGVMLWFNVICFDVWRTMKNRQEVGSRRRFLLYSVYTWVVGAVLTTAVLVVPYLSGKTHDSSLMETNTDDCKLRTEINMILQLVEVVLMVVNLVFLSLAATHTCHYTKFGNGLPRCDAMLSLKQGWKLYIIMIGHTLIDVPDDILSIRVVDLWRYVLIESLALFAVFAYRKTVLRRVYAALCCGRCSPRTDEESNGAVSEKHHLNTKVTLDAIPPLFPLFLCLPCPAPPLDVPQHEGESSMR